MCVKKDESFICTYPCLLHLRYLKHKTLTSLFINKKDIFSENIPCKTFIFEIATGHQFITTSNN